MALQPSQIIGNLGGDFQNDDAGGSWKRGHSSVTITASSSGTTFYSSAGALPANSVIEAVTGAVNVALVGSSSMATWSVGDSSTPARFFSATSSQTTAGTTFVGLAHVDQSGASGPKQLTASTLSVTYTGAASSSAAGSIHLIAYYKTYAPPTS